MHFSASYFELKKTTIYLKITTSLGLSPLLNDSLLDTTSLGQGHLGVVTGSNDENIGLTGGEGVSLLVLDGDNGERSVVLLNVLEGTNASGVVTAGDHHHGSDFELVDIGHLAGGNVDLDGVVDGHVGVGEAKGASIMGDGDGNLLGGHVALLDAAQLVLGLVLLDAVEHKASLGIVEETEEVTTLLEGDNVHETGGVVVIGADLAVDLDAALHADLLALLSGQGVLETFAEDDGNGETFALLVGTLGGLGGPHTSHFAEVPVAGRIEALEMFLGSARPVVEVKRDSELDDSKRARNVFEQSVHYPKEHASDNNTAAATDERQQQHGQSTYIVNYFQRSKEESGLEK